MPTGVSPDMLVVVDGHEDSGAGVAIAQRYANGAVGLTAWDAAQPDLTEVVATVTAQPTVAEALALAAKRRIGWVAVRRGFAEPSRLLGELLTATAQHAGGDLPGFAVFLPTADPGPFRRILAIIDRRGGPISGLLLYAAVAVADTADATLDVLVLSAPGERSPEGTAEQMLAVSREQELYERALQRSRSSGVRINWIAAESTSEPWELIDDQLGHRDYDLIVDDLGDISLRSWLRSSSRGSALAPGQVGEIPLRLLTEKPQTLLLVIDEIRLGIAPASLLKAGTAAALTLGAVSTTVLTVAGATAATASAVSVPAESLAVAEELRAALDSGEDRDTRAAAAAASSRGAASQLGMAGGSSASGVAATRATTPGEVAAATTAAAESASAKPKRAAPKVPKGGASPEQARKARKKAEAMRTTLDRHKAKRSRTASTLRDARDDVDSAQAEARAALAELEGASMSYAVAAEHAQATATQSSGVSGALPGAPSEDDVRTAELLEESSQERLDRAVGTGEEVLSDLASAEKDVAKSEKSLTKKDKAVTAAQADFEAARDTMRAYEASLKEKIKSPVRKGTYKLTARFGDRGRHWSSGVHTGLDFAGKTGTGIYAANSGKVTFAGRSGPYGLRVVINHGDGIRTTYNHLSSLSVSKGQRVYTGDRLGGMGNTGNSTGTHLHFEVKKGGKFVDPERWLGW